ncbi:MAG: FkbM family methyltransferase [Acidimicrobiia bacterium]|nr:FkbM family methyltransferase [Acidimicrobiia bacterium]
MQTVHQSHHRKHDRTSPSIEADATHSAPRSVLVASLDYPNPGGVTSTIDMTVDALANMGTRVDILGLDVDLLGFPIPADLFGTTLLERYWDLRSALLVHAFERATSRGATPDLILATDVVAAHRIMERTTVPVVLVVHGVASAEDIAKGAITEGSQEHGYLLELERTSLREAAAVVAVSESLGARLRSIHPGTRCHVIQNPTNTQHFEPGDQRQARERLRWDTRSAIVFCPSRHNQFKGVQHLVAAAEDIEATVVLTEAPPGPLPDNVLVAGECSHEAMRDRYVASDLVVIPSVMSGAAGETSSLVAIEAAACGVPVIASAVGGLNEVVGALGFETFDPADPKALSSAANRALAARGVVDRDRIRTRAVELHGPDRYVRQLRDVFASVSPRPAPLERRPFFHRSGPAILSAAQAVSGSIPEAVRTLRDDPVSDASVSRFLGAIPLPAHERARLVTLTTPPSGDDLVQLMRRKRYWRHPAVARPVRSIADDPLPSDSAPELRIAYVANRLDPCGGARIVLEHANRLASKGHDVTIYANGPRPTWHHIAAEYQSVPLGAAWYPFVEEADVIVSTYWDQLSDLSRCTGTLVYFEQGDFHLYDDIDEPTRRVVEANLACADITITLSRVAREALESRYGVASITIPNAIDPDVFNANGADRADRRMIIVGNESATFKGTSDLIAVWERLAVEHPDLGLDWVCGQPPQNHPSDPRVRVHVSPDQGTLARLYRDATVYVSASQYETFPLPPLEAMASATPVVSFANGGILEFAIDEENALLAPVGDVTGLARAVERVLTEEHLGSELVDYGLRTAARHRWKDIMNELDSILRSAGDAVTTNESAWTTSCTDRDFMAAEDVDRFRALLESTSASEIELPVIVEGPPHHLVAHWERVAWRSEGTGSERHLLPLSREHADPSRSQQLLMAGNTVEAFKTAKSQFGAGRTDTVRVQALRWMLFSLIELEEDAAAISLAQEALTAYPDHADFHYLAGAIANLAGDHETAAALRSRVLTLGATLDSEEFLWNVTDLASALPSRQPVGQEGDTVDEPAGPVGVESQPIMATAADISFRPPTAAYGTYMGNNRMLIAPRWGGKLIVPADDLSLTPTLVQEGMYDSGLTRFLIANLRPGDTFVDVGANLGVFSILAALRTGPRGHVHAIEANPSLVEVIHDNVALNYLQDRITVTSAAAVAEPGNVDLHVTGRFMGESSIDPAPRDYRGAVSSVTVPGMRLDEIPIDTDVRIMKIDVEGAELAALQGAQRLLTRTEWLIVEWNRVVLADRADAFIEMIRSFMGRGARLGVLREDGAVVGVDLQTAFSVPFRSGLALRF